MDMHLVVGPPGSGKAGRAVAQLCDGSRAGREMFLVVPGAVDRARFLREIAARESGVVLGVEVGTFDQLVARVAGAPPVRRTDAVMERILVRDAIARCTQGSFARAARWAGFVDTARRFVDQMRRARVWGNEHLERVLADTPGGDPGAWLELEGHVEALLRERRLCDDAWFEQRAADAIRHRRRSVDGVVVYGFDTLPDHRIELLERLAGCVPVHVSLEWSPGRIVYERAAALRDRWRRRGAFVEELDQSVVTTHPTLAWVQQELFEPNERTAPHVDEPSDAPAPVAFVDCCGSLQEADEVARELVQLRSRGFAWDDMAVLSADAGMDAEYVIAACARAGVPLRTQLRRRAVDVPAGRALHELLDAVCTDDAVAFVGALRSPVFGLDRELLDRLELRARSVRAVANASLDDRQFTAGVPTHISGLVASARSGGPALPAARELIANLVPSDIGELDLLRGLATALEGVATAAGGDAGISMADVRDTIARFPLTLADRSDSGAVVLSSIEDVRSVTYPAVVVRGLHQSGFTPRVDVDADAPAAARELLHLVVTRARTTLRVVRQSSGSNGNPLAPAPAWIELRRRLPDAPHRARRLEQIAVDVRDVRHAAEVPLAYASAVRDDVPVRAVPEAAVRAVDATRRHPRAERVQGALLDELAATSRIGATAVETYSTCSAMWLVDRRLRVRDVDTDRSRLVEGNVAHELLAALARSARFDAADASVLRSTCTEALPALLAKLDPAGSIDPARCDRIVTNVVDTLLTEGISNWDVPEALAVEQVLDSQHADAFGPGLEVDGVEIVGRVDRIDQYGSHVVLHDYKYRASNVSVGDLLAQRKLQLLIYWLALDQPGSPYEPIGALYRAVTNHGAVSGLARPEVKERGLIAANRRAGILDDDARAQLLGDARALVADALTSLRAGVVRPLDDPSDCPPHCQLQTICRVGESVPA